MSHSFNWPIRVYYQDTDSGGVVYHANYLGFMERARTEWLRSLGFEQDHIREQWGVLFVVRSASIEYLSPARFNDELNIYSTISSSGKSSVSFHQVVTRGEDTVCEADIRIVAIDAHRFRPTPFPEQIKERMENS